MKKLSILCSLLLVMLLGSQTASANHLYKFANQGDALAGCLANEGTTAIGSTTYTATCVRIGDFDYGGGEGTAGGYAFHITPDGYPADLDAWSWPIAYSCDSYVDGCVPATAANPGVNKGPCITCEAKALLAAIFGDPINAGTGNKFETKTEFHGTGPFPLEFTWTYNSAGGSGLDRPFDRILGANRTNNYDRHVRAFIDGAVTSAYISRPDGRTLQFVRNGSSWVAPSDLDGTLTSTRDGNDVVTGWTYRNSRNETEVFDASGALQSLTDANGNVQTLTYDASLRIASVSDMAGRQLTFAYNTVHRLTQLTLPDNSILSFAYDANDNLQTVNYPGGTHTNYLYENASFPHALTGVKDEKDNTYSTTTYDAKGRATSTFLTGNLDRYDATYTDSSDGSYVATAAITSPLGKSRTLTFQLVNGRVTPSGYVDTCAGCPSQTKVFNYTANGHVSSSSDYAGVVTTYTQDANGLETERIESANFAATKRTIQTHWNTTWRQPDERWVYDSSLASPGTLKLHEQWTFSTRGQVLTDVRIGANNPGITRTTTYTYCDAIGAGCPFVGPLTQINGERTDVVDTASFSYYTSSDPCVPSTCRIGDLKTFTNAKSQVTTYNSYDGTGRPLRVTDPNGVVTDFTYSPRGWLTAVKRRGTDNAIEADDAITTIAYELTGKVSRITQPDGSFLNFTYDTAHRVTDVADNLGNTMHYTLDAAGNHTAEQSKDPGNNIKQSLTRAFDQFGRLQNVFNAAGQATATLAYDVNDNLTQVTDALNHITNQTVDKLGRVTNTTQDAGGLAVPVNQQYNALDQVTQVTDPKSLNTTYTYNGFGDLISLASPDTATTTFTVNSAGQRLTQTNARNITLTYGYDALNRLTSVTGPTSAQNFAYTYDTVPSDCVASQGENFGVSHLSQLTDESGTTRYCYDRFGQVVRKVQGVNGGSTLATANVYDHAGNLIAITYPSGAIVNYLLNANGQVTRIDAKPTATAAQVTLVSSVSYLPFGPLSSLTFQHTGANPDRVLTKAYDADYGIDQVSDNAASNPVSEDYSLDRAGNVTGLTERTNASTTVARNYAYDNLDRLTARKDSAGSTLESFTYTGTGDRTSKIVGGTTNNYTYGTTSHWLTNISGVAALGYDAMGNTANFGTAYVFTYDDHDRFRTFTLNGVLSRTYYYNALGQRVLRVVNNAPSQSEQLVYDEAGHLLGEYTTSGARIAEFVWMDDTLVGILKAAEGGTYQFVETDALGTPRAVVNPVNNAIVWRWDITPTSFGDHNPINDPDGNGTNYTLNLRYPGQFNDGLDFINYNGFRDYYANSGRYLESDPIGLGGGISTYGYVGASPLSFADPSGLDPYQPFNSPAEALWDARRFNQGLGGIERRLEHSGWVSPIGKHCWTYSEYTGTPFSTDPENDQGRLDRVKPEGAILAWHDHADHNDKYGNQFSTWKDDPLWGGDYGWAERARTEFVLIAPNGKVQGYDGRTKKLVPVPVTRPEKPCDCGK